MHNITIEGHYLTAYNSDNFIGNWIWGTLFSFPEVYRSTNDSFDLIERNRDILLRHVPTRWLLLMPAMETLLEFSVIKSHFKLWAKKTFFPNSEIY